MFGRWSRSSSSEDDADPIYPSGVEEVFSTPLPPTLPVVKATVDSLTYLAVKQRMFITTHADKIKLELVKEKRDPSIAIGQWYLNGFAFFDEDAVDFVRQCPDALSNLKYVPFSDGTGIWSRITSWLRFGSKGGDVETLSVVDDLAFALTVSETVEIAGHVLGVVSYAMGEQVVKKGKPLRRELAFELSSSAHRGRTHSIYLMATVVHAAQRVASGMTAKTLQLDLSLYIYDSMLLGGLAGVAVNISGTRVDDMPTADVDQYELRSILAKRGTFVASAVSDFVLKSSEDITSERTAIVTLAATDKLTTAANKAMTQFFDDEANVLETGREERRREFAVRMAEEREERRIENLRVVEDERRRLEAVDSD